MKDKTIWMLVLIGAVLYSVWKIVPALTSRITASSAPPSSEDVGSYQQYTPWMQPSIPYPDQADWYGYGNGNQRPGWKDILAQGGAAAGLQAANYYWPSAFGSPDQPPDGGGY